MTENVEPAAPSQAPSAEPKVNSFERISGVFFSPAPTFESIARRPDVLIPLVILLFLTIATTIVSTRAVNFTALATEAMESAPNTAQMTAEQRDRAVRFSGAFMKAINFVSPLLLMLGLAVVSGAVLIGCRVMGGEGDYKQAFAVTTYAWFPRAIKGIIATIVILNRKTLSIYDLQNAVKSNLAFLFDPKTHPMQYALGASIDAFSIWSIVLLVLGFTAVSKMSRTRTAAVVIALWILITLLMLVGPALQAMRMK